MKQRIGGQIIMGRWVLAIVVCLFGLLTSAANSAQPTSTTNFPSKAERAGWRKMEKFRKKQHRRVKYGFGFWLKRRAGGASQYTQQIFGREKSDG